MHPARPIRARRLSPTLRLRLPLERRIGVTHDGIPQIVEAVIVVAQLVLVNRGVAAPHLQDQSVDVGGHVIQAVHLVEHSDCEDVFLGEFFEVHWWREGVRGVGGDVEEAAAFGNEVEPVLLG